MGEVYLNKYYQETSDSEKLKEWKKILNQKNVFYYGNLSPENQNLILPYFQVGIIPYIKDDVFNLYSNPIKLYDYLASGLSVISTPLLNIKRLAGKYPVSIAENASDFTDILHKLLKQKNGVDLKYRDSIKKLIKKESMQTKSRIVFNEINNLF